VQELSNVKSFAESKNGVTFFIPASGSGSRMFQFMFDFLNEPNESNSADMERFMNHLKDFAFYYRLPIELKEKIKNESIEAEELATYLLGSKGFNFSELPKGLIPFHYNEPFVQNPFQDHVIQGVKIANGNAKFHFTIQPEFEAEIKACLSNLEGLTGTKYDVSFSYQSKESDSTAFNENKEPAKIENEIITRPAGHGALLANLNEVETDIVFIKNIDNVQHYSHASSSSDFWKELGGVLLNFKEQVKAIYTNPSKSKLVELNDVFQFLSPQEMNALKTDEDIKTILNRPTRVCGMVKNEGQPGGGPFWIEKDGRVSKQIVEKGQITQKGEQLSLLIKSTHFNPVMIAVSTKSLNGTPFDLLNFCDKDQFFVVNKMHKGQAIKYIELPGLWNGGMANWNTIFVEAPKESFSPVKNVLDLLEHLHIPRS